MRNIDLEDRRNRIVMLTAQGKEVSLQIQAIIEPLKVQILQNRSHGELKLLLDWMNEFRNSLADLEAHAQK